MIRTTEKCQRSVAGFTLIEALIALALTGFVLGSLATVTVQWLPNWNRGFARVQRNESVGITLERLVNDVAAAQFVAANRDTKNPLFEGGELGVVFVRTALGPNARPGLEIVRIAEDADRAGPALVRSVAPFVPFGTGPVLARQINFRDPMVLLRAPYRVSFAYAANDGVWQDTWLNRKGLPVMMRITVRDAANERILPISTATMIHAELSAESVCTGGTGACADQQQAATPGTAQSQSNSTAAPQQAPAMTGGG